MDLIIPKGKTTASKASQVQLNTECKEISATIVEFIDNISNKTFDGVTTQFNNALLRLRLPSLDTKENTVAFTLQFPNKTIEQIQMDMYLFNLTQEDACPKGNSKAGKYILAMKNEDGETMFDSMSDFQKNYKLQGSTEKLYSILRENETEFDLSDLSSSLAGQQLAIQSYYNTKTNDYTIASVKYTPKFKARVSNNASAPRAKSARFY
tara:strand:- start:226 stop:852 length:627 start_codon:yes stop_codon:yes gene_type:complete